MVWVWFHCTRTIFQFQTWPKRKSMNLVLQHPGYNIHAVYCFRKDKLHRGLIKGELGKSPLPVVAASAWGYGRVKPATERGRWWYVCRHGSRHRQPAECSVSLPWTEWRSTGVLITHPAHVIDIPQFTVFTSRITINESLFGLLVPVCWKRYDSVFISFQILLFTVLFSVVGSPYEVYHVLKLE